MIWSRETILRRYDTLRARWGELSDPEVCAEVARILGMNAELVADVVAKRDEVAA